MSLLSWSLCMQSEWIKKTNDSAYQVALECSMKIKWPINSINCYTCSIVKRFDSIPNRKSYFIRYSVACTIETATTMQIIYQFSSPMRKRSIWSLCLCVMFRLSASELYQTARPDMLSHSFSFLCIIMLNWFDWLLRLRHTWLLYNITDIEHRWR